MLSAQNKEGYNWYFGAYVGMTWNTTQTITQDNKTLSGLPTPLPPSAMIDQEEGVFGMSDANGNLLFYSDGMTIWNKNHDVMTNGSDLTGHNSSAQSGIVIPYPGQPHLYIAISMSLNNNHYAYPSYHYGNTLAYSIIDMTESGGLGAVTIKNQKFTGAMGVLGESVAAVRNSNGVDYWIIAVGKGGGINSALNVWEVTTAGVQTACMSSHTLPLYTAASAIMNGYLRFSSDGKHFAWPESAYTRSLFFGTFDPSTGVFPTIKLMDPGYVGYGVEFSSSNEIMYVSDYNNRKRIHAYKFADLLYAANPNNVPHRTVEKSEVSAPIYPLQLAPDERIYSTVYNTTTMVVMDNINDYDNFTVHIVDGLLPTGNNYRARAGLPNYMPHLFAPFATIKDTICQGENYNNYNFNLINPVAGNYYDTITTIHGYDSVAILNLSFHPAFNDTIYTQICDNDSILFGGNYYFTQGIYTDSLKTVFGCDSIVTMNLIVDSLPDNISDADCYVNPVAQEWTIRELPMSNELVDTYGNICVGDIDGDGISEVITTNESIDNIQQDKITGMKVMVFNKTTNMLELKNHFKFPNSVTTNSRGQRAIFRYNGQGYIVVPGNDGYLYAYNINGTQLWKSNTQYQTGQVWVGLDANTASVGIADFNNDGIPEIYAGNKIYTYNGIELCNGGAANNKGIFYYSGTSGVSCIAADIDGDGKLELIAGTQIYDVNIAVGSTSGTMALKVGWQLPNTEFEKMTNDSIIGKDGPSAVVDIDNDGKLEIVVTSTNVGTKKSIATVFVWKPKANDQSQLVGYFSVIKAAGEYNQHSIPLIGNIDNSPTPEIIFTSNFVLYMHALRYDENQPMGQRIVEKWKLAHTDGSGATGSTLFDFNQDGIAEIVYRDETMLRIIDGSGATPSVKATFNNVRSGTMREYPVVADVDGDGQAEILVTGWTGNASNHPAGAEARRGPIRIFKSGSESSPWAPARKVWNQYMYNSVNINEDLTIPKYQLNPATVFPGNDGILGTADDVRPYNNFLQQQTILNKNGNPLWTVPDYELLPNWTVEKNNDQSISFHFCVTNIGDANGSTPFHISLYKDTCDASNLIATNNYNTVPAVDDTICYDLSVPNFANISYSKLILSINDKGECTHIIPECDYTNNKLDINNVLLAVNDSYVFSNDSILFDVLGNDFLGSCERNTLVTFDTISGSGLHNGNLTINNDSTFIYKTTAALGIDSLDYYIECNGKKDTARVYLLKYKELSLQYIACPGAVIKMGFSPISGISFDWYNAQTNGSIVASGNNTNTLTITKGSGNDISTWWVEPKWGNIKFPRIKVYLEGSAYCGSTVPFGCAATGTILFLEDFDKYGNGLNSTSPNLSTQSLPAGRTTYTFTSTIRPSDGSYALAKHWNDGDWRIDGDKTSPNDSEIGRFMLVNADYAPGIFYSHKIEDLCSGSELYFSAMIANCHVAPSYNIKPDLTFSLLNASTNDVIATYNTGAIPYATKASDWQQWGFGFTVPMNIDAVILEIKNNAPGGGGNDLGLDDIEIRLCAPPVNVIADNEVCEGDSIQLVGSFTNGGVFVTPLEYRWLKSATGDLTSQASWTAVGSNSTLTISNVALSDSGYYRLAVSGVGNINLENCRAMSEPIYLSVNTKKYFAYSDTICSNETYHFNGKLLNTSGIHIDTVTTFAGCDSIITLNLTINPSSYDTVNATICLGERYYDANFDTIPTQAGFISYSRNSAGCHVSILNLTINPSYHDTINAAICLDENYSNYGFNIIPSQPGFFTYTQPHQTTQNCDSTIILHLTVNPIYNIYITDTIYEDEFYVIGNDEYNTSGLHIANLQTHAGCDSIINLTLHVINYPPEITAFSPFNYDGVNDYFMPGFNIQIFNRYGAIIYETKTKEQQKLGWDGKNTTGKDVEPGLYFYILYNSTNKPIIKSSVEVLKQ